MNVLYISETSFTVDYTMVQLADCIKIQRSHRRCPSISVSMGWGFATNLGFATGRASTTAPCIVRSVFSVEQPGAHIIFVIVIFV
jgi:hypothetical protein